MSCTHDVTAPSVPVRVGSERAVFLVICGYICWSSPCLQHADDISTTLADKWVAHKVHPGTMLSCTVGQHVVCCRLEPQLSQAADLIFS